MRAGAYGLSLLSNPLNVQILGALGSGALPLPDLRRTVGLPPHTTLRVYLRTLVDIGVLSRRRDREFPGGVSYELTDSGHDLLATAWVLEAWLSGAPDTAIPLGGAAAKSAIKALVDGWSTKILRALAAKPLSLTELDRLIPNVNYPALERRLGAMRLAGQIAAAPGRGASTPYKVTDWLRGAVAPLLAAASWERSRAPAACEDFGRLDAEAAFLLAVPMLELPATLHGTCRLAVDLSNGGQPEEAGVVVEFERGRPVSCRSDQRAEAASWAIGSTAHWLSALRGSPDAGLQIDGNRELVHSVIAGLRRALFPYDEHLSVARASDCPA